MTTLRDHITTNISVNILDIVRVLMAWSVSANPLVKTSKFLTDSSNAHKFDLKVIDELTSITINELLPLLGLDQDRPWAKLDTIRRELEQTIREEQASVFDANIHRMKDRIRDLERENRRLESMCTIDFDPEEDHDSANLLSKLKHTLWKS